MSKQKEVSELDEPVFYCKACHSLAVVGDDSLASEDWDGSYCNICNSTDIGICSIGEWLSEEKRREEEREKNKHRHRV